MRATITATLFLCLFALSFCNKNKEFRLKCFIPAQINISRISDGDSIKIDGQSIGKIHLVKMRDSVFEVSLDFDSSLNIPINSILTYKQNILARNEFLLMKGTSNIYFKDSDTIKVEFYKSTVLFIDSSDLERKISPPKIHIK